MIEWQLPTSLIGRRTLVFPTVDSTNTVAASLARDASADGLAILACEQTGGRGQHGRTWLCPAGSGVLLSVVLFPPPALLRPALLTAWAAVAVCDTLEQLAGVGTSIKWPNDIQVEGKKIAGILIERNTATIAGIGLNLNQSADEFDRAGLPDATSLSIASGHEHSWEDSARSLIRVLDEHYARLLAGDLRTLETIWSDRLGLVGQRVMLECIDGEIRTAQLRQCSWSGIIIERADGVRMTLRPETVRYLAGQSSPRRGKPGGGGVEPRVVAPPGQARRRRG